MAPVSNKSLIFKNIPQGMIKPNVDMALEDKPLELTPPPKGIVVKTLVLGFDPHMRDRMKGPTFESYVPGYVPEEPIQGFSVAQVVKSDNDKFKEGEIIAGVLPFAEYSIVPVEVSLIHSKTHSYSVHSDSQCITAHRVQAHGCTHDLEG